MSNATTTPPENMATLCDSGGSASAVSAEEESAERAATIMAALIMIVLASIYTVASGLYGVVWTDVFQGFLIFFAIVYIIVLALTTATVPDVFSVAYPTQHSCFAETTMTRSRWCAAFPPLTLRASDETTYAVYNRFGVVIFFYLVKVFLEGMGGPTQYMIQRYFAAKSDRDCGMLSLFWIVLLSFRWPFIISIAIIAANINLDEAVIKDPERVLPRVINTAVPNGVRGFLVAGLTAAAMSTFDSTVNAGAAYWVKDIYQAYLRPAASSQTLVWHSRVSSIVIVVLGVLAMLLVKDINTVWGFLTMGLQGGMMSPLVLRWYWWRFNGYGFAAGTLAGLITGIIQKGVAPDIPEYFAFLAGSLASMVASIVVSLLTPPTERAVLCKFYRGTRPFGFWAPARRGLSRDTLRQIDKENRHDMISLAAALPFQICLFLLWMTLIVKNWPAFGVVLLINVVAVIVLKKFWFDQLGTEVSGLEDELQDDDEIQLHTLDETKEEGDTQEENATLDDSDVE